MYRKLKWILILISFNTYAKLPINLNFGIQSAYDIEIIKKEKFEKAGFKDLIYKDVIKHKFLNGIYFDATYKHDLKNLTLDLGLGTTAFISKALNKVEIEKNDDLISKKYTEIEKEVKNLEIEFRDLKVLVDDLDRRYIIANNDLIDYTAEKKRLNKEIDSLDKNMEKDKQLKQEYSDKSKLEKLKQDEAELIKKIDENADKRAKLGATLYQEEEKLNQMEDKIQVLAKKARIEKDSDKKLELRKELTMLVRVEKPDQERKVNKLKSEYAPFVENIKKKSELSDKIVSIETVDARIEKNKKRIKEANKEMENAENKIEESKKIKNEYKKIKVNAKNKKNEMQTMLDSKKEEKENLKTKLNLKEFYNLDSKIALEEKINKHITYGASIYSILGLSKNIYKDINLFSNLKLGITVTNNKIYDISKEFEKEKIKINNVEYLQANSVKKVLIKPAIDISLGLEYKKFKSSLFIAYGKGIAGLNLSYEF